MSETLRALLDIGGQWNVDGSCSWCRWGDNDHAPYCPTAKARTALGLPVSGVPPLAAYLALAATPEPAPAGRLCTCETAHATWCDAAPPAPAEPNPVEKPTRSAPVAEGLREALRRLHDEANEVHGYHGIPCTAGNCYVLAALSPEE